MIFNALSKALESEAPAPITIRLTAVADPDDVLYPINIL